MRFKSLLPVLILGAFLAVLVTAVILVQGRMRRHEQSASTPPPTAAENNGAAVAPIDPNSMPDDLVERQRMADLFPDTLVNVWGIRFKILQEGTGPKPVSGNRVTVHYVARLLDGTEFDSSAKAGKPYTFQLMSGRVIRGWDEAVIDMRKGERRLIVVPYKYAYGSNGRPPVVPPRAPLVFEIELLEFN